MKNIKYGHLKFIPTGNVFKMPYEDAVKIMKSDEDNYEILGEKKVKASVIDDEGIFKQVVVDNDKE